jgi:hypothetical protein
VLGGGKAKHAELPLVKTLRDRQAARGFVIDIEDPVSR